MSKKSNHSASDQLRNLLYALAESVANEEDACLVEEILGDGGLSYSLERLRRKMNHSVEAANDGGTDSKLCETETKCGENRSIGPDIMEESSWTSSVLSRENTSCVRIIGSMSNSSENRAEAFHCLLRQPDPYFLGHTLSEFICILIASEVGIEHDRCKVENIAVDVATRLFYSVQSNEVCNFRSWIFWAVKSCVKHAQCNHLNDSEMLGVDGNQIGAIEDVDEEAQGRERGGVLEVVEGLGSSVRVMSNNRSDDDLESRLVDCDAEAVKLAYRRTIDRLVTEIPSRRKAHHA